ncbi:WXG100 family type VII secretion target [Tomitella biformata]|uniref:WXG100 family type VII secretion target n=1 Tax=Tomitella biformata TaxID=630403 RepID=UPI000464CA7D|nr:WXG100 family type VII secretion target [Tomitella biformata]
MSLQTNAEVMRVSGGKALETAEQMKVTLTKLVGTVEGSAGVWGGGAHGTFNEVMDRFHMSMNKLQTSLVEISDNIKANGVGYEGAEAEVVQDLANVGGALDL